MNMIAKCKNSNSDNNDQYHNHRHCCACYLLPDTSATTTATLEP